MSTYPGTAHVAESSCLDGPSDWVESGGPGTGRDRGTSEPDQDARPSGSTERRSGKERRDGTRSDTLARYPEPRSGLDRRKAQTERAGSPRTALCVGYRPPLDYARAVWRAVVDYGTARADEVKQPGSVAALDATHRARDAVLDLLYGPRAASTEDDTHE